MRLGLSPCRSRRTRACQERRGTCTRGRRTRMWSPWRELNPAVSSLPRKCSATELQGRRWEIDMTRETPLYGLPLRAGGRRGWIRTNGSQLQRLVSYHLTTRPRWCLRSGSNRTPLAYKASALPAMSYRGRLACWAATPGSPRPGSIRAGHWGYSNTRGAVGSTRRRRRGLALLAHYGLLPTASEKALLDGLEPPTPPIRNRVLDPIELQQQDGAACRSRTGVNYSPPAWKAGALPTELRPRRWSPHAGSNREPPVYDTGALPVELQGQGRGATWILGCGRCLGGQASYPEPQRMQG